MTLYLLLEGRCPSMDAMRAGAPTRVSHAMMKPTAADYKSRRGTHAIRASTAPSRRVASRHHERATRSLRGILGAALMWAGRAGGGWVGARWV